MTHLNQEIALTMKIEGEAFASWDGLDDQVVRRIADHFISDRSMMLKERVAEIINARVNALVEARVDAFLLKPIPPVDRFGQPIEGAPARSLADMVLMRLMRQWSRPLTPVTASPRRRTLGAGPPFPVSNGS